jgi:hypothetical protein
VSYKPELLGRKINKINDAEGAMSEKFTILAKMKDFFEIMLRGNLSIKLYVATLEVITYVRFSY